MIGIQLQNVSFSYSSHTIFNNIEATFSSGQRVCFLGDNGAGKTTLLKILCTLLKPHSGNIRYFESDYDLDAQSVRKKMGVQLDDFHLLRQFTVMENLSLYQKLYASNISAEKINEWLDQFGLQVYRETPVQNLSQGEQKKVSLLKAFFHNPDLIILDEPTNSLDQESKATLGKILQGVRSDCLVFVSTHDKLWASSWLTSCYTLKDGQFS